MPLADTLQTTADVPWHVCSSDQLGGVVPEQDDDRPIWEELDDDAWAEGDEPREPPEFGCCLPPGECCMPGLHFPSECHTAADYQRRGR